VDVSCLAGVYGKLQNHKPATRHVKTNECKIALLIDFLCLLPSQSFAFAGLQTFLQLKTRKLTVAFPSPCDLYRTFCVVRKVVRIIPEQMDAALLHIFGHSRSIGFCKLAYSSSFNEAVGWDRHFSEILRNVG
jgi:hypothetical protein